MLLTYLFWPICVILFLVLGFLLGVYWTKKSYEQRLGNIKALADKTVQDAKRDAANIKKEAHLQGQDLVFKMKSECERELGEKRAEQKRQEDRLAQKEEGLDRRSENLARREAEVAKGEAELVKGEKANSEAAAELQAAIRREGEQLERLAQMTAAEAKELLL
jgi:ribonuclease Y